MARAHHRAKDKFYRCARCRSPVVWNYRHCGVCGHEHHTATDDAQAKLIEQIKRTFPGTTEL